MILLTKINFYNYKKIDTKLNNTYNQTHLHRKANETKFFVNQGKFEIPRNKIAKARHAVMI